MTVATTSTSVTYTGDGSTTVFSFAFEIPYQDDGVTAAVAVTTVTAGVETVVPIGALLAISGTGVAAGGSVTFTTAPLAGTLVVISRAKALTQPSAFTNMGLEPSDIEAALDTVVLEMQQLVQESLFRAGPYTFATLPAKPLPGQQAFITDAVGTTFLGTVTGGGTISSPVFYNGTAWVQG